MAIPSPDQSDTDHVKSPVTAAISARDYDQPRKVLRKDPTCAAEYLDSVGIGCLALTTLWPRGSS